MTLSHADKLKPLIWLTEDIPDYATTVIDYLQAKGFRVRHFETNLEASDAIDVATESPGLEEKPQAILVDYNTGDDIDGDRLVQYIRGSGWSELPIIGFSSIPGCNEDMMKAGANSFCSKNKVLGAIKRGNSDFFFDAITTAMNSGLKK